VARGQVAAAMARLGELLARQGAGAAGPADLALDAVLAPPAVDLALAEAIEAAGPFGAGAPAPRFAVPDLVVTGVRPVGEGHLRVSFGAGPARLEAIAFGATGGPLGALLTGGGAGRVHIAGRLELSARNGARRVQFRLDDAARA
jgi:single-stranded-DNA-specific exonuclease